MRSGGVLDKLAALALALTLAGAVTIYGQRREERERVRPPSQPTGNPPADNKNSGKTIIRTQTVTKVVDRTKPSLTVVAESNALVYLEPVNGKAVLEGVVPPGQKSVIFQERLRPGKYKVSAELEGYRISEEEVVITGPKPHKVDLRVTPIVYNVTIQTNIGSGEVRFKSVGASSMSYETVRIQGRTVRLPPLRPGTYNVEITPDEKSYKTLSATLAVTDGDKTLDLLLERDDSRETFTWTNMSDWIAPSGWTAVPGLLKVGGGGIAVPADTRFRNYIDFQIISDIKMVEGVQVSFVLRKRDDRNYYQVQITGPRASEPYVLRGFVVKDSVPTRLGSAIPVNGYASTLQPGQFFTAKLTMKDNRIKVEVQDSQTGEVLPLGILTDPNRTFTKGAVGPASINGERIEIGRFVICPSECQ